MYNIKLLTLSSFISSSVRPSAAVLVQALTLNPKP